MNSSMGSHICWKGKEKGLIPVKAFKDENWHLLSLFIPLKGKTEADLHHDHTLCNHALLVNLRDGLAAAHEGFC